MNPIKAAADALDTALGTVEGLRVYTDPSANIDPPGVVIGPPDLYWDYLDTQPSRALFRLYVVSRADDRMLERLWGFLPDVVEAVASYDRAAVQSGPANAGVFSSGGTDLPAYIVSVDVALEGD